PLLVRQPDWTARARILLDGGERESFVRSDGSFSVHGVAAGSHVLDVYSPEYTYSGVKLEVSDSDGITAMANNHMNNMAATMPYPLKLHPTGKQVYFQPRKGWSPFDLLKNPMLLMMLAMGVMGYFLPKMMENMDEETQAEMKNITPQSAMAELWNGGASESVPKATESTHKKGKKGKKSHN
ncbi:hypothetical protein SARC_10409, partial [Sphaeroforma arctica JP610]